MLDVVFVNPGNAQGIYQGLSNRFAAVEPPTWALLLAESARSVGYAVSIVDVNAEQLNVGEAVERINSMGARLICFVVYGQNPNSGTVNMVGASILASALRDSGSETTRSLVGSHASALPLEVLRTERAIDVVFCNEGVYALRNLLGGNTGGGFTPEGGVDVLGGRVPGPPLLQESSMVSHDCIACELVSVSRHSVPIGTRYCPATPGNIPAVFVHRFAGHTRPRRAHRVSMPKNFI